MLTILRKKIAAFSAIRALLAAVCVISSVAVAEAAQIVVPGDYPTIQGAIDKAGPGDTVVVSDGLYKENIVIKTQVMLRSMNGSERTVVEPVEAGSDVIRVLNVKEGDHGVVITGFTLRGSQAAGLHVIKSPKTKVFSNIFTGNNYGLHVEHSNGCIIKENIANENDTGLYSYFSDECQIEKNVVNLNTNAGILLHSSHKNTLSGNVANNNKWNGITLSSSNDNVVTGNWALKNTYAIVVSESSGNVIEDNSTMPRLYYILPVALVYLAIMFYLIERKLFMLYYHYRYGE